MGFRHECKHEISLCDLMVLRRRLRAVMTPDLHGKDGVYRVRSLYFDNGTDKVLREKLDGCNEREKFRIRCYDLDPGLIRLEKKIRRSGLGRKDYAILSSGEVTMIRDGEWEWMEHDRRPLVRELYGKMLSQGLRPRTIVDYTREAFVFGPGNVRVTLDYDIRTGLYATDFLDPGCVTIPAGDGPIILEVKWDEFLPDLIRDLVRLDGRRTGAFSKYAICRMYD